MKKLFTIAAATLVMFACNKTTEVAPTPKNDATMTLTLAGVNVNPTPGALGVSSRSIGSLPTSVEENTITDMHVFMFDATTKALKKHVVVDVNAITTNANVYTSPKLTVTSGSQDVYVVLNVGTTDFSSVIDVTSYLKVTADLSSQSSTNLTMTGVEPAFTVVAGKSDNKIKMAVTRLAAKVVVKWNIQNPAGGSISTSGNAIYMINVPQFTNFRAIKATPAFADADYTPAAWYYGTGLNKVTDGADPVGTALTALAQSPIAGGSASPTNHVYFYLFENKTISPATEPTNQTRIVFKAKYTPTGGIARDTYYIVNVNKANANTKIDGGTEGVDGALPYVHRNTVYTVTLNIKGEGMSDPWVEPTLTQMDVEMTINAWATVSQEVTFD